MPTLSDLTDEVISQLHGYVDQPAMGTLVGPITATSTELAIDFGDQPGAARPNGVIEIGTELLVVSRFDPNNGVASVSPWGRGHQGTVATSHDAGARVTVRPRYPRKRVREAINETLRSVSPTLFGVRDLPVIDTGLFVGLGYPLPADTLRVLRVDVTEQIDEAFATRCVVRDWTVRAVAGQKLLEVDRGLVLQNLQVTVATVPSPLVDEDDDFATVTGLPESCVDVITLGVLARLILGVEAARQQVISAEAMARADKVPVQSATALSRYYMGLHKDRLAAEQSRLLTTYPPVLLRRG
jgi:hypothetical protein